MKITDLLEQKVKHKVFGAGVVIEASGNYLTVRFAARETKFVYPDAFENFLLADDPAVQAGILEEISNKKLAAEAQRKEAEAERKASEDHRAAE